MYFLTYISNAAPTTKAADIQGIVEKARIKNTKNNVTGLMLFRARMFLQLLEGEKKDVLAIFQKIAADPRHQDVEIIFEAEIKDASKLFPSWQMGFIGDSLGLPNQEALIRALHTLATSVRPEKEKILELLKKFSDTLPASAREILARTGKSNK
jgi:hypothetical protein